MRIPDLAAVQRLIAAEVEESGLLDYKQDLVLKSPTHKRELCRDLTAMGNGGGGTLIYGIRELEGRDGIPEEVTPLTDRSLPLSVADIVRDSVRSPLLYEMAAHDVGDGYVLVVDVEPSGLGPYCVIGYDDFRYWKRHGKSKSEMSEAEIRDAYDLALRSADRQAARWEERALPLRTPERRLPHDDLGDSSGTRTRHPRHATGGVGRAAASGLHPEIPPAVGPEPRPARAAAVGRRLQLRAPGDADSNNAARMVCDHSRAS